MLASVTEMKLAAWLADMVLGFAASLEHAYNKDLIKIIMALLEPLHQSQ
jgi:hypothetical protein